MKWKKIEIKNYPIEKDMKKLGISYRELGKVSGLHYTYLQRIIGGGMMTTEETAAKIIKAVEKLKNKNSF